MVMHCLQKESMTETTILATLDDDLNKLPLFVAGGGSASFHWPNCWACDKVVKILNRQNGQTNSFWNLKFVKTHILGEFHHDVFPLLCLKQFFFGGPPVRSEHFRPLTKRMVSRPALGTVCQARKVSLAFHQAKMRSENVGPGEESIWYEYFWEFLKRINLDIYMGVSENRGTPKSSILIGFCIINHPFWGIPIFGNTHSVSYDLFGYFRWFH